MAVEKISSVYETAPWGITEQPSFLNACLTGQTLLEPKDFLIAAKKIEQNLGRVPGPRYGPRIIDIDILMMDGKIVEEESLILPHPRLEERAFVLAPLNEIAHDLVHPVTGARVEEMLARLDSGSVERLEPKNKRLTKPKRFTWGIKTYVMGIINVTPDSFSGDGIHEQESYVDSAIAQARSFVDYGADILDLGGESTRPGSSPVPEEQELTRVIPVIEAVRAEVDVPISIDTYRSTVALEALNVGADWINDVWALRMDVNMAGVVQSWDCPVILMHNRSKPKNVEQQTQLGGRYVGINYDHLLEEIAEELTESIDIALKAGVSRDNIIIDPGIGFGKTVLQNLQLLNELDYLKKLDFPILVGPSRKSFIGYSLNLPTNDRLEGTAASVSIAIDRGADIVRVHDVKAISRVARMTDLIVR